MANIYQHPPRRRLPGLPVGRDRTARFLRLVDSGPVGIVSVWILIACCGVLALAALVRVGFTVAAAVSTWRHKDAD